MSFWNHKLFFTTQLVSIILAQTLHTFWQKYPTKEHIFIRDNSSIFYLKPLSFEQKQPAEMKYSIS